MRIFKKEEYLQKTYATFSKPEQILKKNENLKKKTKKKKTTFSKPDKILKNGQNP